VLRQQVRRERSASAAGCGAQRLMASMLDSCSLLSSEERLPRPAAQAPLPPGSVRLGLDLPLLLSRELFRLWCGPPTLGHPGGPNRCLRGQSLRVGRSPLTTSDERGASDEDNDDFRR